MDEIAKFFIGAIAHWDDQADRPRYFTGHVLIQNGKITSVGATKNVEEISQKLKLTKYIVTELEPDQLIIPGLVDCHLHASQFPNIGLGLDRPLLEWLAVYTFPLEKQYEDITFATNVYDTVINRTLKHGTTTACYFGTLCMESSIVLAAAAEDRGQRALVGKVSMNVPNEAGYFNTLEKEVEESENFIKLVKNMKSDLVEPIITPRFALSCCGELMNRLGQLARQYDCKIQTHISENLDEVRVAKEMFPDRETYADVYDHANLLTDKCILAHAVHLEQSEMELLKRRGVSVAHCPASNTRLMSGMCPVRKLMKNGITVGLGTDVSGGDSASILDAMRRCMDVSSHLALTGALNASEYKTISWEEAFYLATLGGAKALSLDQKIGNFKIGKEFDALIVDVFNKNSPIDRYEKLEDLPSLCPKRDDERIKQLLQRFVHLGNDMNIIKVFVKGREIAF